jgi:predicted ATPase/DNA-binding CsgD family transcriptional regulator
VTSQPNEPLVEPLTRRERQILGLLAQGFSTPEIAEQLTLAVSSVKWHLQHLYGKLGVNNRQRAIFRATELGLIRPPRPAVEQPAPQHNLPLPATRFFGREAELRQLKQRLAEYPLVTLTGPGGVGKTRLALRLGQETLGKYREGVWFVELAALADPALVPAAIAVTLGVPDDPVQTMLETLLHRLRDWHGLLVIDNCEHLLEGCAQLADSLLATCPKLNLLACSREPLGVAGEAVFLVPPLAFPEPGIVPSLESLGQYAAIRLFADRARLVQPDYEITFQNSAALAHICQRLDGIPLAIEMAAARINTLTAEALAAQLDDTFRALTSGRLTAVPRQQTLQATIDWSYNLLTESERRLLRQLAVFAGGCTLAATEAVCTGADVEAPPQPAVLASLVAKSMVLAQQPAGLATRYRLLEMTRQYALEKLEAAGESPAAHRRHRDFFLAFAERRSSATDTESWNQWRLRFEADRENLRQAMDWSFSDEAVIDAGPRLVNVLMYEWSTHQEELEMYQRAIAWCESHPAIAPELFVQVLNEATRYAALNIPQVALRWSRQAVALARTAGLDRSDLLRAALAELAGTLVLGLTQVERPAEQARAAIDELEALFRAGRPTAWAGQPEATQLANFANLRARLALLTGDYARAKQQAGTSLRLLETLNPVSPFEVDAAHILIGWASAYLGEYSAARQHILQACGGRNDLPRNYVSGTAYTHRWLAFIDLRQGELERAHEYCQVSLRQALKMPDYNIVASCLGLCACLAAEQSQPKRAAQLAGASHTLYARQGRYPWEDTTLDTLLPGWPDRSDRAFIEQAYAAGQSMSVDQAVAMARAGEVI